MPGRLRTPPASWGGRAYALRDAIPFTYFSLLSVLAVVGTYFLCSTLVFPEEPADWPDFDDYYMRTKRIVAVGVLAANLAMIGFTAALVIAGRTFDAPTRSTPFDAALSLLFLPLITALIFATAKRIKLMRLVLLNLVRVLGAVAPVFEGV